MENVGITDPITIGHQLPKILKIRKQRLLQMVNVVLQHRNAVLARSLSEEQNDVEENEP